ncbi:MAG TPA: 6,7-dimethyl-8-ribityllumazine synthase [Nitrospiraceae bacterium]|jgi:6,7-dimethyl-8-ribityllumazine synthase|nr:6,7-dimethyl-8-ribityllumazine synthase [Nitrospiraceae bacterium]
MKTLEGQLDAGALRFGIVVSKFNEFVTGRLLAGALEVLDKAGAGAQAIEVVKVPGAFEIPLVARRLARSRRFDAIICLGAVIRGATPHFEYISTEVSRGIAQVSWDFDMPVIFGVLTTETVEQAMERAGAAERNRGAEAARTAIEMANIMKQLQPPTGKSRSRSSRLRRRGRR